MLHKLIRTIGYLARVRRNNFRITLIVLTTILTFDYATSQSDSIVVSSFQAIHDSYKEYYSSSPCFLEEQPYLKSPSKSIYFLHRYVLVDIRENIERTNSLTTPFIASLSVSSDDYINLQNGGTFVDEQTKRSFHSSVQSCIADTAFAINRSPNGKIFPPNQTMFTFRYQKGKWIFSSYKDLFLARGLHLPYNDRWVKLLKRYSE